MFFIIFNSTDSGMSDSCECELKSSASRTNYLNFGVSDELPEVFTKLNVLSFDVLDAASLSCFARSLLQRSYRGINLTLNWPIFKRLTPITCITFRLD